MLVSPIHAISVDRPLAPMFPAAAAMRVSVTMFPFDCIFGRPPTGGDGMKGSRSAARRGGAAHVSLAEDSDSKGLRTQKPPDCSTEHTQVCRSTAYSSKQPSKVLSSLRVPEDADYETCIGPPASCSFRPVVSCTTERASFGPSLGLPCALLRLVSSVIPAQFQFHVSIPISNSNSLPRCSVAETRWALERPAPGVRGLRRELLLGGGTGRYCTHCTHCTLNRYLVG